MNSLHDALHQFVQMSDKSDLDFTELAAQLDILQQCFAVGMTPEQIACLLSILSDEAQAYADKVSYVREELEFEIKLLSSGRDRRTLAIPAVGETTGQDADWALCDTRASRVTI